MVHRSSSSTSGTFSSTNALGTSSRPLDRALGVVVTLGAAVMMIQVLVQQQERRRRRRHRRSNHTVATATSTTSTAAKEKKKKKGSNRWWNVVYNSVSEMILMTPDSDDDDYDEQDHDDDNDEDSDAIMTLRTGACHCRAVIFEFRALASLKAKDGDGKIHYPHVRIPAADFTFKSGGNDLKRYYVSVPASTATSGVKPIMAAFTFCGRCGVHVLHAPSAHSNTLDINVDCLDTKIAISKKKENLSHGVPIITNTNANTTINANINTSTNTSTAMNHHLGNEEEEDDFENGLSTLGLSTAGTSLDEYDDEFAPVTSVKVPTTATTTSPDLLLTTSPGTPSTVGTNSTDLLPSHVRTFKLDGNDSVTGGDRSVVSLPVLRMNRLRPSPIDSSSSIASASGTGLDSGSVSSHPTTTPEWRRDQLKFYMRKHVSKSQQGESNTTTPISSTTAANPTATMPKQTTTTVFSPTSLM